eukprot:UN06296
MYHYIFIGGGIILIIMLCTTLLMHILKKRNKTLVHFPNPHHQLFQTPSPYADDAAEENISDLFRVDNSSANIPMVVAHNVGNDKNVSLSPQKQQEQEKEAS